MTDLERVRRHFEYAGRGNNHYHQHLSDLDAHLKEDAERDAASRQFYLDRSAELRECQAELTELRKAYESDEYAIEQAAEVVAALKEARKALDTAGTRLAQVQPGVTESWAFDIVPNAEQEIANALGRIDTAITNAEGEGAEGP